MGFSQDLSETHGADSIIPKVWKRTLRKESNLLCFQNTVIVRLAYTCYHGATAHTREVDTLAMCLNFLLLVFWRSAKSKKKIHPNLQVSIHWTT